ncbi:MAG: T9SS type A sorting domain-containing protein [Bacteroidota bacterium]
MKKIISFIFVLPAMVCRAQVPLNSVVEHFTNTKCSICASRNPGFQTNLIAHPQVTQLSVHPSAPYGACVLSVQNKKDNDDRTNLYGVYGSTPRLIVNGNIIPATADYSSASLFSPYIGLTTAVSMRIEQSNFAKDSIRAKVVIKKHTATTGNARLFVGLAEDTVFVNGGNGELMHYNVFRKSLTGAAPISVSLAFPVGDSVSIEMTGTVNFFWYMSRMFVVAMLHENATFNLLQSARSIPLKSAGILASNEAVEFNISPNPVKDILSINLSDNEYLDYRLFDLMGSVKLTGTVSGRSGIDMSYLPNALYLLQLTNHEGKKTQQKVLLQR